MSLSSVFGRHTPRSRGVVLLFLLLATVLCGAKGSPPARGPDLKEGLVVERDLRGGETHVYPVDLQAGQFLRVKVQEQGIDVEVVLLDPQGAFVTGADSLSLKSAVHSLEDLAAVTESPGRYLVEIRSTNKSSRKGHYQLEVAALHTTAGGDEALRSEAVKAVWEGLHSPLGPSGDERLEHSLGLWERLGERRKLAEAYSGLGDRRFTRPDEFEKAAEDYVRAAALWREQVDPDAKSWQNLALNQAATLLKRLGRPEEARKLYEEALAISGGDDVTNQTSTLNNLSQLALDQGDVQRAVTLLLESAGKARKAGDKLAEALTLDTLGTAYLQIAESQTALQKYQEALALARAVSAVRLEAQIESDLGNVYGQLGESEAALKPLRQALEIHRRLGARAEEARVLINLGDAFLSLERFAEARQSFDHSLAVARAIKDEDTECFVLGRQAGMFLNLNQPAKGLEPAEEAMRLAAGFPSRELGAIYTLGKIHRDTGELRQAREELDRALALARKKGERGLEADIDLSLAKLEQRQGNSMQAVDRANAGLEIVESIRNRVSDLRLRTSFLATKQIFYEIYIDTLMSASGATPDPDRVAMALAVSERARARSLLDILNESGADLHAGANPALVEREHRLRDEVNARDRFRLALLTQEQPDRRDLKDAEAKLEEALADYSQVQSDLRTSSPAYAALTQPQPLSVAEIQAQILDGKALLLEYALGEKRSFLWAVTPDSVRSFELPGRARIEKLARRYYELLTARNRRPTGENQAERKHRFDRADADAEKLGRELSHLLLGPVQRLLGRRPLLIVADGALQYIPFAALPASSASRPLAADHEVVNLPSASALAVLRRDVHGRARAPKALAIFADPVFQQTDERLTQRPGGIEKMKLASATRDGWSPEGERHGGEERLIFRRLLSTAREAREIAALVPADQRLLALGFDASRARALSPELAQYRDLHFATHGELDSRHPELSKLVLSLYDRNGHPEDGFLRLNDVYNLHLDADLVVLSACRTALGQEIRGEGLVGLTRGFMYAGAARVLASLWSVEDRATADLMTSFYRDLLRQGLSPAQALRRAQLEIAGQPGRKSPYYWAGFSLQGEWR
ncbi:MAG TPA: CHAT domain-containing protein [Thermoanaerobaculia bacterium]|nr:CHAT domain-containing protein [Thermoanaerobaculia bacterium]